MKTTHTIISNDSRRMKELEDNSIDLIITSPPYWQLKDYGSQNEIGYNTSYEEYINHLNLVWNEAYRVLDNGCRLCINIGDQYARAAFYGRYKIIPIRTEIIKFCESIGLDYMGAIIWQKVATTNTSGGAVIMGSFPYPKNGILKLDYEFILIFKKPGTGSRYISSETKKKSALTKEEWNTYFAGHWNFVGERQKKHLAMFPLELPHRLIKMFSFVGETVLDPFLGSGTTSLAALELGRNSVGYEINPEFLPVIREKLKMNELNFKKNSTVTILTPERKPINYKKQIEKLTYIFKDPVKLDLIADPKSEHFGSAIDKTSKEKTREEYFSVEKILSPEKVALKKKGIIRLIGIKENPSTREDAVRFLEEKMKGTRVFLKYENENDKEGKEAGDGYIPAYIFLKNKTFVNAHLVRSGLVGVDEESEYRHKKKFLGLVQDLE